MPYPSNSNFVPSDPYKQSWSLVPQIRKISADGYSTNSMYSALSSLIPLFYLSMFLAIACDFYLGFAILAKSGVGIIAISLTIIGDLILAVLPFFISDNNKELNSIRIENKIFQKELECKAQKVNETPDQFKDRRSEIQDGILTTLKTSKRNIFIIRTLLIIGLFALAYIKIWQYMKVLPPGINIWNIVNGKVVIFCAILCAVFHLLGTEKAIAHLNFLRKKKEYKIFIHNNVGRPAEIPLPIPYKGEYRECKAGNTSVSLENGEWKLRHIGIIKDDEIADLINAQDEIGAIRGIAITCKNQQII